MTCHAYGLDYQRVRFGTRAVNIKVLQLRSRELDMAWHITARDWTWRQARVSGRRGRSRRDTRVMDLPVIEDTLRLSSKLW